MPSTCTEHTQTCAANNNPRLDRSIFENCASSEASSTRPSPLIVLLVEAYVIHQLLTFFHLLQLVVVPVVDVPPTA